MNKKVLENVIQKAEFLTKLEVPNVFKSMKPSQEIFELPHKIPSYQRDDIKDEEELKETPGGIQFNVWREHYKTWKSQLKNQGTISSRQQQNNEIKQVGTAAVIVCL